MPVAIIRRSQNMARKLKLSPKKQAWADQFKPQRLRGGVLRQAPSSAIRYHDKLSALIAQMCAATEREVTKLFTSPVAVESHVTTDASIASQSRILMNALNSQFITIFAQASKPLAENMVNDVQKSSAGTLKKSLEELAGKISVNTKVLTTGPVADIAKASVIENVSLIKSIPQQYLKKVEGAVMRSITTGNGLQDLTPFMKKQKGMTERRAKNIALDQTRKAYNSINKGRMQAAGVGKFEWIHTGGGQKPRQDHIEMSGNVYSFDDLPVIDQRTGERGIPGQAPNCRCTMRPIVDFGED